MAHPYGLQTSPGIGNGFGGLPQRSSEPRGEWVFPLPGTYSVTIPDDVYSICGVVGAGSGSSAITTYKASSGAAGGLAWKNNIPVMPGQVITVVVGDRGQASYIIAMDVCAASGGASGSVSTSVPAAGGTMLAGDGGGTGGSGAYCDRTADTSTAIATGGGAPGYSGKGGDGVTNALGTRSGNPGTGGGGASGAAATSTAYGSGGVGMFGEGPSGTAGSTNGLGGSGGMNGDNRKPGLFCAGASAISTDPAGVLGAHGFARIVYGPGRAFPSTDVGPS